MSIRVVAHGVVGLYIQPEKSERNLTINPHSKRFHSKCEQVESAHVKLEARAKKQTNKQTNKNKQKKKQTESKVTLSILFAPNPIFAWPER